MFNHNQLNYIKVRISCYILNNIIYISEKLIVFYLPNHWPKMFKNALKNHYWIRFNGFLLRKKYILEELVKYLIQLLIRFVLKLSVNESFHSDLIVHTSPSGSVIKLNLKKIAIAIWISSSPKETWCNELGRKVIYHWSQRWLKES